MGKPVILTFHVIAAELAIGTLSFAVTMVLLRVALNRLNASGRSGWLKSADELVKGSGYLAAIFGLVALLAAMATGFLVWPLPALLLSLAVRTKIMLSSLSVVLWLTFIVLRTVHGRKVWRDRVLGGVAFFSAVGGFLAMAGTASMAGRLGGKFSLVHFALEQAGAWAAAVAGALVPADYRLVLLAFVTIAAAFALSRRPAGQQPGNGWPAWRRRRLTLARGRAR